VRKKQFVVVVMLMSRAVAGEAKRCSSVAPLQIAHASLPVAWGVESEGKDEVQPYFMLSRLHLSCMHLSLRIIKLPFT
jgi:hypothetical protein